jgi:hypothetical protein
MCIALLSLQRAGKGEKRNRKNNKQTKSKGLAAGLRGSSEPPAWAKRPKERRGEAPMQATEHNAVLCRCQLPARDRVVPRRCVALSRRIPGSLSSAAVCHAATAQRICTNDTQPQRVCTELLHTAPVCRLVARPSSP